MNTFMVSQDVSKNIVRSRVANCLERAFRNRFSWKVVFRWRITYTFSKQFSFWNVLFNNK